MSNAQTVTDNAYVALSQEFLTCLKQEKDAASIVEEYASWNLQELLDAVTTREEKLAFWVNTYNAYVIYLLREDPSKFEDRGKFFTSKQFKIAGIDFSLDDIEHGIIRDSRVKWGLGYVQKWFVPKHIRKLRNTARDGRVHFALNCGAKSCPPVAIYDDTRVYEQLDESSKRYLHEVSTVEGKTVTTTPLFSWFRGDFGGKKGIKEALAKYGVIEDSKKIDLEFGSYDWILLIGNFTTL